MIVQLGIETGVNDQGGKVIKRAKALLLNGYSAQDIKEGVLKIASPGSLVFTDGLASYNAIEDRFGHTVLLSEKGSNFPQLHWHIFNLKNWIRGTHHHISQKHATRYLDEYHYRFNNRNFIKSKFNDILKTMVELPWLSYSRACGN